MKHKNISRNTLLKPRYASALNDLGWLLATCPDASVRNVTEAEQCAERACQLTGNSDPMHLDTLAVAKSEAGQFSQAIALTEKAIGLARAAGNMAVADPLEAHLIFYRNHQSYTQGSAESAASSRH